MSRCFGCVQENCRFSGDCDCGCHGRGLPEPPIGVLSVQELEAENARLRAELQALKPKPLYPKTVFESNIWLDAYGESVHESEGVVRVRTIATATSPTSVAYDVSAKVKQEDGSWV